MFNLPSKQNLKLQLALNEFKANGRIVICEPCNCGSQVRHNNGGNYHSIITIKRDETPTIHNRGTGRVFVKYDSTCDLIPTAEWEEINRIQAEAVIKQYADWL